MRSITALGRTVDLTALPADLDIIAEVVAPLARTRRYAGQCPLPLSVAEHSVRGARAILAEAGQYEDVPFRPTRNRPPLDTAEAYGVVQREERWPLARAAAALFLLHDDHEAFSGDIATPFVEMATVAASRRYSDEKHQAERAAIDVDNGIADAKHLISRQIQTIAGIGDTPSFAALIIVADMDHRMGAEERARLFPHVAAESDRTAEALNRPPVDIRAWHPPEPTVWDESRAVIEWRVTWNSLDVGKPLEVPFDD